MRETMIHSALPAQIFNDFIITVAGGITEEILITWTFADTHPTQKRNTKTKKSFHINSNPSLQIYSYFPYFFFVFINQIRAAPDACSSLARESSHCLLFFGHRTIRNYIRFCITLKLIIFGASAKTSKSINFHIDLK